MSYRLVLLTFSAAAIAGWITAGAADSAGADTGICPSGVTNTWTGAAGDGSWTNGANWSTSSPPGSSDYACLPANAPGPASIVVPAVSVRQLLSYRPLEVTSTLSTANGADFEADAVWRENPSLGGPSVQIGPGVTVTLSAALNLSGAVTVTNAGVVRLVDGAGVQYHGASDSWTWLNYGTLVFADSSGAYLSGGGSSRFVNLPSGVVSKTGSATVNRLNVNGQLENDGTVTSSSGVLAFAGWIAASPVTGSNGVSDGVFTTTGDGHVDLASTNSVGPSTSFGANVWVTGTLTGVVSLPAGVTLNVGIDPANPSGNGIINAAVDGAGTLNVVSGKVQAPIRGQITLNVSGAAYPGCCTGYVAADLSNATVSMGANSGFAPKSDGTALQISANTTVTLSGSLTLSGAVTVANAGVVRVVNGANMSNHGASDSWTWLNSGRLEFVDSWGAYLSGGGSSRFVNLPSGVVSKTGTAAVDYFGASGQTENDGTVISSGGVLDMGGGAGAPPVAGNGVSEGVYATTGNGHLDLRGTTVSAATTYEGSNIWIIGTLFGAVNLPAGVTLNVGFDPANTYGPGALKAPVDGAGTLNVVGGTVQAPVQGDVTLNVSGAPGSNYPNARIAADLSNATVNMGAYSVFTKKPDNTATQISAYTTVTMTSTPYIASGVELINNGTMNFGSSGYLSCTNWPYTCPPSTSFSFANKRTLIVNNPNGSFVRTFYIGSGTFDNTGTLVQTGYYPGTNIVFSGANVIHRGDTVFHNMADAPWMQTVRDDSVVQAIANGVHLVTLAQSASFYLAASATRIAVGACVNANGSLAIASASVSVCLLVDPSGHEVVVLSLSAGVGPTVPRDSKQWNLHDIFQASGTVDAGSYVLWRGPIDLADPPAATDVGGPFVCQNGTIAFNLSITGQHCWGPQNDVPFSLDTNFPITTPGIHSGFLGVGTGQGASMSLTANYSLVISCGRWYSITLHVCPSVNVIQPSISGTAAVGHTLTASPGTWSDSPSSFAYQWLRCATVSPSSCTPIIGAGASQYPVTTADAGKYLAVRVTATNSGGSTSADSKPPTYVT